MREDRTGSILAGCRIAGLLGRGSMGEVWRGTHLALKRPVALKVLAVRDADAEEAILREARALARVEHPNVVKVYDVKFENESVCMILELLEGRTLRERLEADGPLAETELLDVAAGVARGLGAIHAAGLVHRDLKLDNVMLTDAGAVKITDFGVALGPGGDAFAGAVVGTPAYISPEQWLGRPLDARADLYALGVLLYACAAGRPPFAAKDVDGYKLAHLKSPVPRPKDVDPGFTDVLLKLLRKDRAKRYASVDAFLEDLERVRRGEAPLAAAAKTLRCGFCAEAVVPVKGRCPTCHEPLGGPSGPLDLGMRPNEFACPGCGAVVERGARACPGCAKGFCRNCLVKLAAAAGLCAGCGAAAPR